MNKTVTISPSAASILITTTQSAGVILSDTYPISRLRASRQTDSQGFKNFFLYADDIEIASLSDNPSQDGFGNVVFGSTTADTAWVSTLSNNIGTGSAGGSGSVALNPTDIATGIDNSTDIEVMKGYLLDIKNELTSSKSIADLLVQDSSSTPRFFVRQEIYNDTAGTSSIVLRNLDGTAPAPVPVLPVVPVKDKEQREDIQSRYLTKIAGTGYAAGEIVSFHRFVSTLDGSSVFTVVYNDTTQAVITAPPSADLDEVSDASIDVLKNLYARRNRYQTTFYEAQTNDLVNAYWVIGDCIQLSFTEQSGVVVNSFSNLTSFAMPSLSIGAAGAPDLITDLEPLDRKRNDILRSIDTRQKLVTTTVDGTKTAQDVYLVNQESQRVVSYNTSATTGAGLIAIETTDSEGVKTYKNLAGTVVVPTGTINPYYPVNRYVNKRYKAITTDATNNYWAIGETLAFTATEINGVLVQKWGNESRANNTLSSANLSINVVGAPVIPTDAIPIEETVSTVNDLVSGFSTQIAGKDTGNGKVRPVKVAASSVIALKTDDSLVVQASPNDYYDVFDYFRGTVVASTVAVGDILVRYNRINSVGATVTSTISNLTTGVSPITTVNFNTANPVSLVSNHETVGSTAYTRLTDGTNAATIKSANTAAVLADTSLVAVISPNTYFDEVSNHIATVISGTIAVGNILQRTIRKTNLGVPFLTNIVNLTTGTTQTGAEFTAAAPINLNVNHENVSSTAFTRLTDGTNSAVVKAGNTAPLLGDAAIVVTLSGNSANMSGLSPSVSANRHALSGGQYLLTSPILTNNQQAPVLLNERGAQVVAFKELTNTIGQINPTADTALVTAKKLYKILFTNNTAVAHFIQIHSSAVALTVASVPTLGHVYRVPANSTFILGTETFGESGETLSASPRIGISTTFGTFTAATGGNLANMSLQIKQET